MTDDHLIRSGALQGMPVTGLGGARLGTVREVYVDPVQGVVRFVLVSSPSFLAGMAKSHPIPWEMLSYDPGARAFRSEIGRDELKTSPSYDADQLASPEYGWSEQAARYFLRDRPARRNTRAGSSASP